MSTSLPPNRRERLRRRPDWSVAWPFPPTKERESVKRTPPAFRVEDAKRRWGSLLSHLRRKEKLADRFASTAEVLAGVVQKPLSRGDSRGSVRVEVCVSRSAMQPINLLQDQDLMDC